MTTYEEWRVTGTAEPTTEMVSREKYNRLLEANRKLVDRLEALEGIEDERDRALGALEDARRELAKLRRKGQA